MLLSPQGESLFKSSREALAIINRGVSQLYQEAIPGELTISSTQAFTNLWLMPRLQGFVEKHPDIQIRFVPSAGFEDLKHAHIDLAIRFGTEVDKSTPKPLACEYFGESDVYPVCSSLLASKVNLNAPQALLSNWLVTLENPGPYDWQSWFSHAGVNGYDAHSQWTKVNSTDMALNAVQSGHGVTLAVPYLCQHQLDSGELIIPFDIPHPNKVKRYLVYDPNSPRLARLNAFMSWIKGEME